MEQLADSTGATADQFRQRRQFVSEALIGPLRQYRDQVLAHRARTEAFMTSDDDSQNTRTGIDDRPLLLEQPMTN